MGYKLTKLEQTFETKFNFFCKMTATFSSAKTSKQKRVEVFVYNQKYEPLTSVEYLIGGGWRDAFSCDWRNLFSLTGVFVVLFVVMIGTLFLGNTYCKNVNRDADVRLLEIKTDFDRVKSLSDKPDSLVWSASEHLTTAETLCREQQNFLGQIAIAVLVLSVLRQLIPRAQEMGRKSANERLKKK